MLYQVDAFTDQVFKGNPAGVYLSEKPLTNHFMQNLALEMNLSETAFTWLENGARQIRFFTPLIEVALCGHATLATAHILWEQGIEKEEELKFHALETEINLWKEADKIAFIFPTTTVDLTEENLDEVIGLKARANYKTAQNNNNWHISILENEDKVKNLTVNVNLLEEKGKSLIVLAKGEKVDYVLRVFAPCAGIPEDPVTGYAQTITTPIWKELTGGTDFTSRQLSQRGGYIESQIKENKVIIKGKAITVFKIESVFLRIED